MAAQTAKKDELDLDIKNIDIQRHKGKNNLAKISPSNHFTKKRESSFSENQYMNESLNLLIVCDMRL